MSIGSARSRQESRLAVPTNLSVQMVLANVTSSVRLMSTQRTYSSQSLRATGTRAGLLGQFAERDHDRPPMVIAEKLHRNAAADARLVHQTLQGREIHRPNAIY